VLVRKHGLDRNEARLRVDGWRAVAELVPTSEAVFQAALELAGDHNLQIYDAIILAGAVHARCDVLLSEDMQSGFTWRGVQVIDPFAPDPGSRVAALLR
jgi:predicted nucleic acid-binding protein